jgi:hypothetical protein
MHDIGEVVTGPINLVISFAVSQEASPEVLTVEITLQLVLFQFIWGTLKQFCAEITCKLNLHETVIDMFGKKFLVVYFMQSSVQF